MAHLFKPVSVKPIPRNAVVTTVKGVRYAKWTNRKHKQVTAEVTADGMKCRVESPIWWIEYTNAAGKRERVKGFPSREATSHLATDLERKANDIRAGRDAPRHESPSHLTDHLPAFQEMLEGKGRSESHVTSVVRNLNAVITGVGLTTPGTVNCERVANWLAQERRRENWSAANYNRYVIFLRQFGKWLVRTKRAKHNPFEGMESLATAGDDKRTRRRLPDNEFALLFEATRTTVYTPGRGRPCVLPGPDRARLYLLAAYTGFRIATLASLTPEAFAWDGKFPVAVTAAAKLQKNRKPLTIPLHPTVAAELADWLRARERGLQIFPPGNWSRRGAEMIERDLAAARTAWIASAKTKAEQATRQQGDALTFRNHAGEVFDFHALRVQFISNLAIARVPLTAAQQLAGHSTPNLTANVYTKWGPQELATEVAKLPGVSGLGFGLGGNTSRNVPKAGQRPKRKKAG